MARARVRVRTSAAYHQYRALAERLREADPTLKRQLRERIREEGQPALAALRTAAMGIQMSGGPAGSTGLRGRIANATRLHVLSRGVQFRVHPEMVDPRYGATLTAGSEGETWRHPVFGNRAVWVPQTGSPWFYPTARAHTPAFRAAVIQAMRDTLAEIDG
jgi:hypothetical protein